MTLYKSFIYEKMNSYATDQSRTVDSNCLIRKENSTTKTPDTHKTSRTYEKQEIKNFHRRRYRNLKFDIKIKPK